MPHREHPPGALAPATGRYEELNVFGTRTGQVAHVVKGEKLPAAPRGFTWRGRRERTSGVSGPDGHPERQFDVPAYGALPHLPNQSFRAHHGRLFRGMRVG